MPILVPAVLIFAGLVSAVALKHLRGAVLIATGVAAIASAFASFAAYLVLPATPGNRELGAQIFLLMVALSLGVFAGGIALMIA